MKIIFVESYPQVIFGQQKTLLSLLGASRNAMHQSVLATTSHGPFVDTAEAEGFDSTILPYPESLSTYGGAIYRYGWRRKIGMLFQLGNYILELRKWLKGISPDILFCNDMRGLLTMGVAAKSLGIPVVIWDKLDKSHGILDWFQLPLVKLNIVISDAVEVKYPDWQKHLYRKRIIKNYNGALLSRFDNISPARASLGLVPEHIAFAMVGSINERKAQDRILRLMPELAERCPNARILIVGEAEDGAQEYFESLPNVDHPHVIHTGFRDDIPQIMASIDSLLILSRQEGMGQVTVEAMAASRPVIGTRAGGIPEVVVDGETGLLVEGDDDEALLNAIAQLCDDPDKRQRMGSAGRARVEANFDRPKQHRKVIKLMEQLVEGAR
ncbi:glycosyltransferase family 4 protein [Cobetia amphilecti]|uniref:glycosyltransferase family 4 protein n=1 Tax=Cobetia amphilecti TaxID=1055104 RepID=UPI00254F45C3|nr:glycosyltransferase family 4 protein [Cobetia amphilecti]